MPFLGFASGTLPSSHWLHHVLAASVGIRDSLAEPLRDHLGELAGRGWKRKRVLGQRVACFLPGYLVSIAGFGKPKKKCLSIAPALKTSSGGLGARFRSCEASNHLVVFCQSGETCGEFTKIPGLAHFPHVLRILWLVAHIVSESSEQSL